MPLIVSPARTTYTVSPVDGLAGVFGAGLAGAGFPAAGLPVVEAPPGTSSFCPGRIRTPPRLSRFFSTIAWIVVRCAIDRCHRVSPGRTVTVFQELEATGATAAWAGSASAATSAKGMRWVLSWSPGGGGTSVEGRSEGFGRFGRG